MHQFLTTIPDVKTIVYDIGLLNEEVEELSRKFPRVTVRRFIFDLYPEFVKLSSPDAGAYAWKPIIVSDVCREFPNDVVIWCDAGNKISNFQALCNITTQCGLHSAATSGTMRKWTHPHTLSNMKVPSEYFEKRMRNAACVGIASSRARELVQEWRTYALDKNNSLPEGANRSNHRHDQSILTYLFYRYEFPVVDDFIGYSLHNDID
jgi:hypothetical protein